MRIKFLRASRPGESSVSYEQGSIHEMSETSAARWLRRLAAVVVEGDATNDPDPVAAPIVDAKPSAPVKKTKRAK